MVWQERQIELLREEIEIVLAYLSSTPDLLRLVNEPLIKAMGESGNGGAQSHPWPLLPLIVCEAISGNYEPALPAAAALQLLKAAAEVFDDIEDADSSESLAARYGNAAATNAGTALLILAERSLVRLKYRCVEDSAIVRVIDSINSFYTTACMGQHLDLSLSPEKAASEDMYLKIADLKSASTVECACRVGSIIATADQVLIDKFSVFGHNLGMAAQIANDILGITRDSDILDRKITLPAVYALAQTEGEEHQQLENAFIRQTGTDPAKIKDLLFRTGAVHYAALKMELFKQQALDILTELEGKGTSIERLKLFLK